MTQQATTRRAISVVAPCYNEEECVTEFVQRASAACREVAGDSFEIVLVDDGSSDRTWPIIRDLAEAYPQVTGVRLMRNHGHQLAATAGLSVCKGERVMLVDADLQDPPELLADMMSLMDEGADVVYGQRRMREGEGRFKLLSASLFYRILSRLSQVPIPRDTGDFRLMRREVVDVLNAMPERHRFIRGMVGWIGGRQVPFLYDRKSRYAGKTKYPLLKMIGFAADAITSFSIAPLRLAIWLGGCSAVVAVLLVVYSIIRWMSGHTLTGWTSLMAALAAFSAIQMVILGIMGEYLGRLVMDVKGRPLFMIGEIVSSAQPSADD